MTPLLTSVATALASIVFPVPGREWVCGGEGRTREGSVEGRVGGGEGGTTEGGRVREGVEMGERV